MNGRVGNHYVFVTRSVRGLAPLAAIWVSDLF